MSRKPKVAFLIAVALALVMRTRPAHAVSCTTLEYQLPKLDTVVEAKIQAIPEPGRARLTVIRYFKGTGAPVLEAEVVMLGSGQRMDWMQIPRRGDRVLIGFVRQDQTLRNDICHLLTVLKSGDEIPAILGEGTPPVGGVPLEPASSATWFLLGGLLVAGAAGAWFLTNRRKA
ncbi:MAG TPA: LPXTG cell wall anchor domain-containing protein [Symbiobacteriaceae bacterium]|nr:LPXTG cell wall anchor domain-containing protein [Symbiobacteriaceae bacterium]